MPGCNLALKCAHSQSEECTAWTERKVVQNVSENAKGTTAEVGKNRRGYTDVQAAPRFPIKLPVALKSSGSQLDGAGWEKAAEPIESENISANGVLFPMDADVPLGSSVDFALSRPADV